MSRLNKTYDELLAEVADLRQKLDEANDTLNAIRSGEIDALVVSALDGEKIYTLKGADYTYRVLLEQMQEGAVILNSGGFILYGNKYLAQLLKCPLEKIIGASPHSFLSPADGAAFDSYIKQSSARNVRGELHMLVTDGSMVPVSVSITTIQIEQEEFRFIVVVDLTEQKSNEEERVRIYKRVDQIFNATPVGICVIDLEGRITQANVSFLRMFDFDEKKVIGKKCNEVLRLDICGTGACPINTLIAGNQIKNYEFSKIISSGKNLYCSVIMVPLMDLKGRITGMIKNFIDITERKELEISFQRLLERERHHISYDLHESLVQMLAGINFKLESIRMKLEKTAPYLDEKLNNTMDLIQDAMSQAKDLSRGLSPVEMKPEGFMDALEELVRATRSTFGVSCIIDTSGKIFFSDNMKATYLYYIILEAINNSIKHTDTKNIYLNFITRGGRLIVSISDDGKGAPQTDTKNNGLGLRIMEYRAHAIGATFELSHNVHGSYQINVSNISLT